MSEPDAALCLAPAPGALCLRARHTLCQSLHRGPVVLSQDFLCEVPGLSVRVCVRARRSSPGALSVGAWCRGPVLSVRAPRSLVSGPGALCVGARRSSPGAVSVELRYKNNPGSTHTRTKSADTQPGAVGVCVGARRSSPGALCVGGLVLSVGSSAVLSQDSFVTSRQSGVGFRRFLSAPIAQSCHLSGRPLPSACYHVPSHPSGTAGPQLHRMPQPRIRHRVPPIQTPNPPPIHGTAASCGGIASPRLRCVPQHRGNRVPARRVPFF